MWRLSRRTGRSGFRNDPGQRRLPFCMAPSPKPPVLWSSLITRWAVALLLVIAVVIALRPTIATWLAGSRHFFTSGHSADIRLLGVAPDGENVLLDARGRP